MIKKIDVSGLKELSLDEIKKQEVDILSYVADFCERKGINYLLADGTFSKILDRKTIAIENGLEYHSQGGAWVDVFPLDAVPDDKKSAEKHFKKCLMYYNLFTVRVNLDLFSKKLKKLYHLFRYFVKYKKFDIFRKPSFLYQRFQKQLQSVSPE